LLRFDNYTKSFGFVVYEDSNNEINAINVVKSEENKGVFAKNQNGKISYSK
jgi:hypothetical protein